MNDVVYVVTWGADDDHTIQAIFDNEVDLRAYLDAQPPYIGPVVEAWKLNNPDGHLVQRGFEVTLYKADTHPSNRNGLPNVDDWLVREDGEEEWELTEESPRWLNPGDTCIILGRDRDNAFEVARQVIAEQNAGQTTL